MRAHFPRQMRRHWTSHRSRHRFHIGDRFWYRRNRLRLVQLQRFQSQFQVLDLPIQFLRGPSELHAPQLGDQQFQLLDLAVAGHDQFMLRNDQGVVKEDVQCGHTPALLYLPATPISSQASSTTIFATPNAANLKKLSFQMKPHVPQ
jgi:hypothetical protein